MRAVVAFSVLLALCAVVLSVTASAQPPPPGHESFIIMFNDSSCTQHLRTERIRMNSSATRCEPEELRTHNLSTIFQCDTNHASNVTTLKQQVYNDTLMCDNTPIISLTSTATAHTCAPIQVAYEGQKATVYGHIDCAPENATSTSATQATLNLKAAAASMAAERPRSLLSRLLGQ